MNSYSIKLFCFLFAMFLLIACKESTDTPPFILCIDVKLINEDGGLPLKEHKDKIEYITVNLANSINNAGEVINISYIDYPDCLRIQVLEWNAISKKDGNYEQEYIMEIHYPEEIRKKTDILKIKVQFKDAIPSVIEAFYNDQKAQYMGLDVIYFEIENV